MRSHVAMRMHRGGLGDSSVSSIVSQLSSYTSAQIMEAFNSFRGTFNSEQGDLAEMTQWGAANINTLTLDGKALYLQAVQTKTTVVNSMQDNLSQFSAVLQALGIGGSESAFLSGYTFYRSRRLGIIPVIVGVVAAIIAIVIGVGVYEYYQSQIEEARKQEAQAKTMTQAASQVPALIQAGWSPAQIDNYLQTLNKGQNPAPNPLKDIPWMTLGIIGGVVLVARSLFQ